VELRLRAGEPELVVTPAPAEPADDPDPVPAAGPPLPDGEDGATARINLRLPEQLKTAVEQAAARERLSVNAWLVRAAAAAVARDERGPRRRGGPAGDAFTGWVR
jgi:hypothetical protein